MYHYFSSIEDSEKEFLRQHLLRNFEEPVNPLAVQLAVLIAKIARYNMCDIIYRNELISMLMSLFHM